VTSRTRTFVALALVLLVLTPVGAALALNGDPEATMLAAAAGTSTSQSTAAATAAPTTAAPTTVPATEPATTAAPDTTPATEAPTTAAPTTAVVTLPPTTKAPAAPRAPAPAPTFPPPPPMAGPPVTVDAATAFKYAKEIADANVAPPAPAPAPEPEPVAAPTDNPLDQLSAADQGFLACVRWRESRNDYTVVNVSSGAGGAYQFMQSTWNITAAHFGRPDLIGLRPNWATPHDQDMLAVHLLLWYGRSPWGYSC
jgi:hypothetical protein